MSVDLPGNTENQNSIANNQASQWMNWWFPQQGQGLSQPAPSLNPQNAALQNLLWQQSSANLFSGNLSGGLTTAGQSPFLPTSSSGSSGLTQWFLQSFPPTKSIFQYLLQFSWMQMLFTKLFGQGAVQQAAPQPKLEFKLVVGEGPEGKGQVVETNKYQIAFDGKKSSWTIINKETGEAVNSHGDPHLKALGPDGKKVKFKKKDWSNGTFTFILDDGTKITGHAKGKKGVTTDVSIYTPDGQYVTVDKVNKKKPEATYFSTGGLGAEDAEADGDIVAVGGGGNSLYEVNQDINKDGVTGNKYFGEKDDADTYDAEKFFDPSLSPFIDVTPGVNVSDQWDDLSEAMEEEG